MIRNGVKEMISKKMENMVANSSAIRAMFEEGNRLAKIYGAENVYDFSLGNPNVPAPEAVKKAMIDILNEEDPIVLHGYTNSNAGYEDVRQAVADSLNERFGTSFAAKNITMTVGAAGGLNVILKALLNPGDEVVVFAPYFGEYRSYTNNYDGVIVEISPDTATFQPKLDEFREKLSPKTKAVIVITGKTDLVTDGQQIYLIDNGVLDMSRITGTGCMLDGVIAGFIGANPDQILEAVTTAVSAMGICGEYAKEKAEGTGTLKVHLMDAMSNMNAEWMERSSQIESKC